MNSIRTINDNSFTCVDSQEYKDELLSSIWKNIEWVLFDEFNEDLYFLMSHKLYYKIRHIEPTSIELDDGKIQFEVIIE